MTNVEEVFLLLQSKRKTRMTKSYAPIDNGLTQLLGIQNKPDKKQDYKFCSVLREYLPLDYFYVKQDRQHIDPRYLTVDDYRDPCKPIQDQCVKNQREMGKFIPDCERYYEGATITNFLSEDEKNA